MSQSTLNPSTIPVPPRYTESDRGATSIDLFNTNDICFIQFYILGNSGSHEYFSAIDTTVCWPEWHAHV